MFWGKKFIIKRSIKVKESANSQGALGFISILLGLLSIFVTFFPKMDEKINDFFEDKVVFLLIFVMIIFIVILYRMNKKDDEIIKLEEDLKSETKNLWNKYGQLNQFYKEQNLLRLLKIYVISNPEVTSIQRYRYSISSNSKCLTIKIQGDYNYIEENTEINTISQGYYKFDLELLSKLKGAYASSKKSIKTENSYDDDYNDLISLYVELVTDLRKCKSIVTFDNENQSLNEATTTSEEEAVNETAATTTSEEEAVNETVATTTNEEEAVTDITSNNHPHKQQNVTYIKYYRNVYHMDDDVITKFYLLQIVIKELENGLNSEIPFPFDDEFLEQIKDKTKSGMDIAIFLLKNHLKIEHGQEIFEYKGYSDSKKNRYYSNVQVQNNVGENYAFVIAQHLNLSISKMSREKKVKMNTQEFIELLEDDFYFIN